MNALCSDTAKSIYKALAINAVVGGFYAGALYLESTDASLIQRVTTTFAQCVVNNVTCAMGCQVNDWCAIKGDEHHVPGLPIGSMIAMPLLSGLTGIATGYMWSKIRKTPLEDAAPSCTAKKIIRAGLAVGALTLFPASIYFESNHLSIANMVSSSVSRCSLNNVTCSAACDVTKWCDILTQEHYFPLQSLVSAAVMSPLSWLAGFVGTEGIRSACAAKGRKVHEYRPISALERKQQEIENAPLVTGSDFKVYSTDDE